MRFPKPKITKSGVSALSSSVKCPSGKPFELRAWNIAKDIKKEMPIKIYDKIRSLTLRGVMAGDQKYANGRRYTATRIK